MRYFYVLLLTLMPQICLAQSQEASLAWFTDATIANSVKTAKPAGAPPNAPGTVGNGVLLNSAVGIENPLLIQNRGMIEFWIKPNWNGNDGVTHRILRVGDPNNGMLIEKSAAGTLRFVMITPNRTAATRYDVSDWLTGKWHHIAVTWNDHAGPPKGLALWIDKVCVDSVIFDGTAFMNPSSMSDSKVYIGDSSTDVVMDELIFRKNFYTSNPPSPGQLEIVYRDYFQTAPYTNQRIDPDANVIRSDSRVVNGSKKQFGLEAQIEGEWVDITNFEARGYWNWSNFDAKPFITWSTSNSSVATVDSNGLVTGKSIGTCTLTAKFRGMTSTYPITVISWNQPDLCLMYVERLPRYSAKATKKWPSEGETVTSVAHIGNFGYQTVPAGTVVRFELIPDANNNFVVDPDEHPIITQTATITSALAPEATTTVSFPWTWTQSPVFVRVTVDPNNAISEICEANNERCELNIARSFRWGYDPVKFSNDYTGRRLNLVGSFSDYDWCNAEVDRMALLMRDTIYPTTSLVGIRDSIRVDNYYERLYGNWQDEPWVINEEYYDGGFPDMEPENSTVMDFDPAIGHEIGHTTYGLPDLYGHPTTTYNMLLKDENGTPYAGTRLYPAIDGGHTAMLSSGFLGYRSQLGLGYAPLMVSCHMWLHPANAGLTDHYRQQRIGLPGVRFDELIPQDNRLTVYDVNDQPLSGAAVYVYQISHPMVPHADAKYFPDRVKYMGYTNTNGIYVFPKNAHPTWDDWDTDEVDGAIPTWNPFVHAKSGALAPSYVAAEILLLKIVTGDQVEFHQLPLTEFAEEYLSGNTNLGTYKVRTNLSPSTSVTPLVIPEYPDEIKTINRKPVAVIPEKIRVRRGQRYTIDASGSYDPEGQPLQYRWMSPSTAFTPIYSGVAPQIYTDFDVQLYVMDGLRASNLATTRVEIVGGSLVSGRVTDTMGNPVVGAAVGIKKTPFATADAMIYLTTDTNGYYGPEFVSPGSYYIATWKQGWEPSADAQIIVHDDTPITQNLQLSRLAGKNIIAGKTSKVSASNSDGGNVAGRAVDGDYDSAWSTIWWPEDPTYFYIDLTTPTNISGITIYRYLENTISRDDYQIDVMTSGTPLDPASWEGNSSVTTVYSATQTLHGYPVRSNLAADAFRMPLNGIRGIRLKFDNPYWPPTHDIREIQIHSTTEFGGMACGWVKDALGNPIYNAVVQVGGVASRTALVTDNTGYWAFDLAPGTYELFSDAPNYGAKIANITIPSLGLPLVKNVVLDSKEEIGQYNGDFEIIDPADPTKPDGWELFVNDGGGNPRMYNWGREAHDNTTPGGTASAWIRTGTHNPTAPYWAYAWLRPTASKRVPVDPSKQYNCYLKCRMEEGTWAAGFWAFVWRRANGTEISRAEHPGLMIAPTSWTQYLSGLYGGSTKPMIRMTPPAEAATLEVQLGITNWPGDTGVVLGLYFDDIVIDSVSPFMPESQRLSDTKNMEDGEYVYLNGKQITALPGAGIPAKTAYIEEADRHAGIRLDLSTLSNWTVKVGDSANIKGVMSTTPDGERCIAVSQLTMASRTTAIEPLFLGTLGLGGKSFDLQEGTWEIRNSTLTESASVNNIGLLVKLTGKITQIDPAEQFFYIDDGSGITDGSTTGGVENVGIRVGLNGTSFTAGRVITITGISSCFKHTDGKLRKLLRVLNINWP